MINVLGSEEAIDSLLDAYEKGEDIEKILKTRISSLRHAINLMGGIRQRIALIRSTSGKNADNTAMQKYKDLEKLIQTRFEEILL